MTDEKALRQSMVDGQLRPFDVTDKSVLAAMLEVPRTEFVAPELKAIAYSEASLVISSQSSRRLLQPMVIGRMLQAVTILPGEKVLDLAAGSGYSAAVMTKMGARVTAIESDPIAIQIARTQSGRYGFTLVEGAIDRAPTGLGLFDVIVINGVIEIEPDPLLHALMDGGRLVSLFANGRASFIRVIKRSGREFGQTRIANASGPVLSEFQRKAEFAF